MRALRGYVEPPHMTTGCSRCVTTKQLAPVVRKQSVGPHLIVRQAFLDTPPAFHAKELTSFDVHFQAENLCCLVVQANSLYSVSSEVPFARSYLEQRLETGVYRYAGSSSAIKLARPAT